MSRIGKQPIEVPSTVAVAISPGRVQVNGPLGELSQQVPARIAIEHEEGQITVTRPTDRGEDRALHGLTRSLVANMVEGVTHGFEKHLELHGVGYRAQLKGTDLELAVGFSHSVPVKPRAGITFEVPAPNQIVVKRPTERGEDRALHGLTRSLIANMVEGVTNGFQKRLEIQGVGYRAALRGTDLELNVGFSHSVVLKAPQGITFEVPTPTEVIVKGIDKQQVGQLAAEVRKVRPPEPYKGKGIRYQGEYVRRKVGKRA